jgi:hypothetical protein
VGWKGEVPGAAAEGSPAGAAALRCPAKPAPNGGTDTAHTPSTAGVVTQPAASSLLVPLPCCISYV